MNLMKRAEQFASHHHSGQTYEGGPYTVHLSTVAGLLEAYGAPDHLVAAGWLHDVVEDTEATIDDVRSEFGPKVAQLVEAVTNRPDQSQLERLSESIHGDMAATMLKLADRIANVEASKRGGRHAQRYLAQHEGFREIVEPAAMPNMLRRYDQAIERLR